MSQGKIDKTVLEVEIDAALAAEAKAAGVDLAAMLEEALRMKSGIALQAEWRTANGPALDAFDRHIEQDGLWSDGLRTW